ncbi:MAG: hypothetical protein AABZ21_03080, partial [Deltaproteobacteria bacterium]
EIKVIVMEGYNRAKKILVENIDTLHRLANALLEKEVLDGAEIDRIIFGGNGGGTAPLKEDVSIRTATA